MKKTVGGISLKTEAEIAKMLAGGRILAGVRERLKSVLKVGTNALEIEELATKLIVAAGAQPSFKMVPGYSWSTCINVNAGLVHGIPSKNTIFQRGDLVSVDLGVYYQGFHTDASFSLALDLDREIGKFLRTGEAALGKAIRAVRVGGKIGDISRAIETVIEEAGYAPIRALVGHGVGRELHEEPAIPCFTEGKEGQAVIIKEGMTLAIEVMYALGRNEVEIAADGWTISTRDGKISGLFEETVAATKNGPLVLTAPDVRN